MNTTRNLTKRSTLFRYAFLLVFCAGVVGMSAPQATAALVLPPGASPTAVPVTAPPILAGALATAVTPFASVPGGVSFTGSLTSEVFADDGTNPFAGGLIFTYIVTSTGGSDAITGFRVNGYAGWLVEVAQAVIGGTDAPTSGASRSSGSGDTIRFDFFSTPELKLNSSNELIVYTNAVSWMNTTFTAQDGASTGGVGPALSPAPEPASVIAWGLMGLIGLGYAWRRRSVA